MFEEQAIDFFLSDLKNEVRGWLQALFPSSGYQAMEFASHVSIATTHPSEESNKNYSPLNLGSNDQLTSNQIGEAAHSLAASLNTYPKPDFYSKPNPFTKPNISNSPSPHVRQLTQAEWGDKRRLGLRFTYGHDHPLQHKCSTDDNGDVNVVATDPKHGDNSFSDHEILKLKGKKNGYSALILVDSGPNLISKILSGALGLERAETGPIHIRLGDGSRVWIPHQLCRTCQYLELKDRARKEKDKYEVCTILEDDVVVGGIFNKQLRI